MAFLFSPALLSLKGLQVLFIEGEHYVRRLLGSPWPEAPASARHDLGPGHLCHLPFPTTKGLGRVVSLRPQDCFRDSPD